MIRVPLLRTGLAGEAGTAFRPPDPTDPAHRIAIPCCAECCAPTGQLSERPLTLTNLLHKRLRLLAIGARSASDAVAVTEERDPGADRRASAGWRGRADRPRPHRHPRLGLRTSAGEGPRRPGQPDAVSARRPGLGAARPRHPAGGPRGPGGGGGRGPAAAAARHLRDTTWPACPHHRQHPLWLGNTTVAGPRGAARAMMRRSARWGTAGAAG